MIILRIVDLDITLRIDSLPMLTKKSRFAKRGVIKLHAYNDYKKSIAKKFQCTMSNKITMAKNFMANIERGLSRKKRLKPVCS